MTGYVFGLALTLAGALVGLAGVRRRVDDAMFFGGMALVGGIAIAAAGVLIWHIWQW